MAQAIQLLTSDPEAPETNVDQDTHFDRILVVAVSSSPPKQIVQIFSQS